MKNTSMLWTMLMIIGGAGLAGFGFVHLLAWIYEKFGPAAPQAAMIGLLTMTFATGVIGRLVQGRRR